MKENKNFKRLVIFAIAATMCMTGFSILPTVSAAAPVVGIYTPGPGVFTTWQTYSDDGTYYGNGLLEVGNVIMGWNSIFPNSLWDLCPNTLLWSPNTATDLIINDVDPYPAQTGTIVTYIGGELQLDESLWGGTAGTKQMVDLDGAIATISSVNLAQHTVTMDIVATGTFVSYPTYYVTFSATFTDSTTDTMSGFSGTPSNVEIIICQCQSEVWVDDDAVPSWYDCSHVPFIQSGVDRVCVGGTVNVFDGTYGVTGQTNQDGYSTAILIKDKDDLTIQAVPGNEPVVKPVTLVEASIVTISIENCDNLIIDNIDSDQTIAQFDNWHVFDSDGLTLKNSKFEGGEDGIDFNTALTTALIENNIFKDITTGNGDEVLDFTDGACTDVTIQDNFFDYNYRHMTLNNGDTNFIIRRNIMDGTNSQEAIRLIDASNILVENNIIMNNRQQGIYIDSGCSDITVQHNTFFNNDQENGPNGEIRTKILTADIIIKNNILYGNGLNPAFETTAASLPSEDYNCVYNTVDTGFTFGPNTITGQDPKFISTVAGSEDLHLQGTSPCIDAGTNLGVTEDIEGNPRDPNPDMGAYECQCTPVCINHPDEIEYCTIQAAIDALATVDGETIEVYAGTHVEQVNIYKDLTIYGQGIGDTIIQSPDTLTDYFTTSANNYPVVYIHDVDDVVIHDLTVDGAGKGNANHRFVGVGIYQAGATLQDLEVINVRDTPFSGVQHGIAIYGWSDLTGTPHTINFYNCDIYDFQKNAIAIAGSDFTVDIDGCTITGAGPTSVTAQNGIQVGYGATGSITGNTVTGVSYTGPTWAASGILPVYAGYLDISGNIIHENQVNIYLVEGSADIVGNDIYATLVGVGVPGFYGIIGDPGNPPGIPDQAAFDDNGPPTTVKQTYYMNCNGNIIVSDGSDATSVGVGVYAGVGGGPSDIAFTAMYNDVYSWGYGFELYAYAGSQLLNADINCNNIVGNTYGIYNWLTNTYDGTCNWWGATNGPGPVGPGSGDSVSDYVTYCPWLDAPYPFGDCVGGAVAQNLQTGELFCSIQKAIDDDDTMDGHTIEVFAGTHPGNIIVYKELTIQSQSGAASTIIDASSVDYSTYQNAWGHGINYAWAETWDPGLLRNGFCIWNDTVTIDGFSIINANYPSSYNRGIGVLIGSIHTTYAGHVPWNIDQWGGIVPSPDEPTPTGVLIKNNIIDGASDGIYNWASNGNTMEYNTISNTDPLGGTGIQCYEGGTDNIIRGNTVDNTADAICVAGAWPDVLLDVSDTLVTENILTNNNVGIKFYNVAGSGVIASYNDIFDNAKGIFIEGAGGALVATAYCNNIVGNTIGVENGVSDGTFDAECNWWGDCSGPSGEGPGTAGDAVSINVDFNPWTGMVIADAGGPLYEDTDCDDDYTITFDGSSSYVPCTCVGETLTYDWDFGDGHTSTVESPTHTYDNFGEYTVTLTVTGSVYGCTDTATATVKIYGVNADANGPYNIPEDIFTVNFDGSGSTGYEMPLTYDWDFGDGTGWHNDIGATPTYTYAQAGNYIVTLRVTESGNGCFDIATTTVHISGEDPPIIQIIYPEDGETINGVFTIRWFAIDDDYPQSIGIPIYLYYKPMNADWSARRQINDVLTNNVDMMHGEYDWDTTALSDGDYVLIAETHDLEYNFVHDTVEITISNSNADVMVSDVHILDTSIGSDAFVKDGDNLEITAGITGPTTETTTVTADLSGFGMGTNVPATSFDGFTATWTISNVICTPSDGTITITVTVNEIHSKSATTTADNTNPEMNIEKPVNGLYLFNSKLLPLSRTIIIGPIDIEITGSSDIAKAEFYIDNELIKTDTSSTPEWYMNIKLRGKHNLEVIVYDHAGNTITESKMITVYNFFGK